MDDGQLERLAIEEIIEELERKKQIELAGQQPQERKIRPNSRFLGRTIVSVLRHNKRRNTEEIRNSSRKLRELNKRRRSRSRSRSREPRRIRRKSPKYQNQNRTEQLDYYPQQDEANDQIPTGIHLDLATIFLNNFNKLLLNKDQGKTAKKQKKVKQKKNKLHTIDLTKKKKNKKKKRTKKTVKSKKRGRTKKRSHKSKRSSSSSTSSTSSSSSSDISLSTICDGNSEDSNDDGSRTSALMIDLT